MDMAAEQALASYMDEYFYARLIETGELSAVERIHDIEMQKKGVDVIAEKNDDKAYIDEKGQLYYINQGLPTFAFELGYLKDGRSCIGWLLNDELLTSRYFLLWPEAETDDLSILTKDMFTSVYGMMIKKEDLINFLDENGLFRETLLRVEKELRRQGKQGKHRSLMDGVYFFLSSSESYSEAPINLVISKKILRELASACYKITPNELIRIK